MTFRPRMRNRTCEGGSTRVTTVGSSSARSCRRRTRFPKDGPVGRLLEALGRHAWRPAHLHLKVSHPGHEQLTTMVYFEGDPWLNSDTINSVKVPLVVALERLPADDRWDRPHALCTFDVKLRPIG